MNETFEIGERVRVRLNLDACGQAGKRHGWAIEGRTGTIVAIEQGSPEQHCYVVAYFHPPVVVEEFPGGFSPQFHNWFAPWEIERCGG